MNKILVPTDLSKLSKEAFKTAKEIALKTGAEIHLLHGSFLIEPSQLKHAKSNLNKKEIKAEKKHIEKLEKLKHKNHNLTIRTHYCNTNFVSEILSYSKNNLIDLIVMATDDHKTQEAYLAESNALTIVRLSQCPVLVIKDEDYEWKGTEIIFASDFQEEAIPSFKNLLDIAIDLNLKINFTRIGLPGKSNEEINTLVAPFTALCPKENLGVIWEHNDDSIEEGINYISKKLGYYAVAICCHHREYDISFYDRNLSEGIIYEAKTPVLTVPLLVDELAE